MGILNTLKRAAKFVGKKILSTAVIWGPALIGVGIGLAIGGPLAIPLAIAMGAGFGYLGMRWKTRQLQERNAAQAEEAKNSAKREQSPGQDPRSGVPMDPAQLKRFEQFQRFEKIQELERDLKALKAFGAYEGSQEADKHARTSQPPTPASRDGLQRSESVRTDRETSRSRSVSPAPSHSAEIARTMPPGFSTDRRGSHGRGDSNAVNVPTQNRERNAGRGRGKG
ncbi:hypothetical protein ACIP79_08030 [Streptomyces sp. NPDC088747]|uniref:hypothetical protein n=1 Tax=Streptomyces sp. NPDC088747 TaxID=3365886 RepID=UPI00382676F1